MPIAAEQALSQSIMTNYININKGRLVGRNNNVCPPLIFAFDTIAELSFQFIDDRQQIQHLDPSELSGLYFAGSLKLGEQSYNLLFLSKDYTIENDTVTFSVETYTTPYLEKIRKPNTEIWIEMGQISLDKKRVLMRSNALAYPRCYSSGNDPLPIDTENFYTKEETNELVAQSLDVAEEFASGLAYELSGALDGKVDTSTFAEAVDNIENEISAVSGSIEGFATTEYVDAAVSGKASKDEVDASLENINGNISTLSGDVLGQAEDISEISGAIDSLVIPTKVSELDNDSGFATSGYVDGQVSGKADQSALTAHTSDTEIHTTALEKAAWDAKQNAITADSKLAYSLLSGTPAIPTKTSDLVNDSGYQTASDVEAAINGKQDKITAQNKLDYALLSGVPEDNLALVPIEVKTASGDCIYEVDFTGKAIQKYDLASATGGSNSLEILFTNLANIPSGVVPTIELQIPVTEADVSTISLPAGSQVIDMPDTLTYTSGKIAYQDIVFRAEKDVNDDIIVYCNYAYKFEEEEAV